MNKLGMNLSYMGKLFANPVLPIPVYSTGPLAGITLSRRITKLKGFPCKEPNKPLSDTSKHLPSEPPPRLISFAHPTSPTLIISLKDEGRRRLLGLQWNPQSTAEVLEHSLGDVNGNAGESPEEHGPTESLSLQSTFLVWTLCIRRSCPHPCFLTQQHDYLFFPAFPVWWHFLYLVLGHLRPFTRIIVYFYFTKNVLLIMHQAMCQSLACNTSLNLSNKLVKYYDCTHFPERKTETWKTT